MLSPPEGLPQEVLARTLARGWHLTAVSAGYLPLGFGSHHWAVTDSAGGRWFVTADDLDDRRQAAGEPREEVLSRLRAALTAARALRDSGAAFVVAPAATADGALLARASDQFSVALYPLVEGQRFGWDAYRDAAHRMGVLDLVVAVHAAPAAVRRHARPDEFAVPWRGELAAAPHGNGPYARAASELLAAWTGPLRRQFARYDRLVTVLTGREGALAEGEGVLTHGEPHSGNTLRAGGRWLLVDWDTALVAPRERDLWQLDPGDGSILAAYAAATGVTPRPAVLELYRRRWALADIVGLAASLRRYRTPSADGDESLALLRSLLEQVSSGD